MFQRPTKPVPIAKQLATTALGVNPGGSIGRALTMHKGVGLNQNSGGLNSRGSGARPLPPLSPFPRPAGGWRRVMRNGRLVTVAANMLTPAERAQPPGRSQRPASKVPQVAAPRPVPAAPPGGVVPSETSPISWDSLSSYKSRMADTTLETGNQRASLQRTLDDNRALWDRGVSDGMRDFERGLASNESSMNHRGLLRSGAREIADADAKQRYDRYMEDLNNQHGSVAAARVSSELARLDEWAAQQRIAAEQAARAEYDQVYPAAPIVEEVAPQVGSGKPAVAKPAVSVPADWQSIRRSVGSGLPAKKPAGGKPVSAGWRVVNGRIVRA